LLDLDLFEPGADQDGSRLDLTWILEALTQRDQQYLVDHPSTPLLYQSGVTYEPPAQFNGDCPEVQILKQALGANAHDLKVKATLDTVQAVLGGERFRDVGRIIEKGVVDCDNLSCWRAAELRQAGIKASPYITWRRRFDGGYTYHVLVRWPDNTLEDPSLLLGMGGADRQADRAIQIAQNAERVQMAKDAAARGGVGSAAFPAAPNGDSAPSAAPLDSSFGAAPIDSSFGAAPIDDILRIVGGGR
jgi:hypothetical protein